jgi:hypothetical protein
MTNITAVLNKRIYTKTRAKKRNLRFTCSQCLNITELKQLSVKWNIVIIIIIISGTTALHRALAFLTDFMMVRYVQCGVISPTINLLLVTLIRPPETSVSKASRHLVAKQVKREWETWPLNFTDKHLSCSHAINVRYGTDGFTSPPKEGVLWILSPSKSIVLGRVWTREPWVQWQAR